MIQMKELIERFIKSVYWWTYERRKLRKYWIDWMTYDGTRRKH